MSKHPQITTVIPTYRRPKLLQRAIQSVLSQTYGNFEVRVYDNASGDETRDVVESFAARDPRVHYYAHTENIGWLGNFDFGMHRVTTPWFSLMSDDDALLPRFFETAVTQLARFPEAMFFAGLTIQTDSIGRTFDVPIAKWREGLYRPPKAFLEMLTKGHPSWTAMLFKRQVLDAVGGLDASIGGPTDLDFELRVAAKCVGVVSRTPCAVFFTHRDSVTSANGLQHMWEGMARIAAKIRTAPEIQPSLREALSAAANDRFGRLILRHAPQLACHQQTAVCLAASRILRTELERPQAARFTEIVARPGFRGALARFLYCTARAGFRAIRWPDRTLTAIRARGEMAEYEVLVREALRDVPPEDFCRASSPSLCGVASPARPSL